MRYTKFIIFVFFITKGSIVFSQVTWQSLTNISLVSGALRKTSGALSDYTDNEAISSNILASNQDGYVEFFTSGSLFNTNDFRIYVEEVKSNGTIGTVELRAELNNFTLNCYDGNNVLKGNVTVPGAVTYFRIERIGNLIRLRQTSNNVIVNTSTIAIDVTKQLRIRCNIYRLNSYLNVSNTDFGIPANPIPTCNAPTIVSNETLNYTTSQTFNGNGVLNSVARTYVDDMGRTIQSQSASFADQLVFTQQPVYDQQGRPSLQTLPAPKSSSNYAIQYDPNFIKNNSGNNYSSSDFDISATVTNPNPVQNSAPGTLGWYYSTNNSVEPYTPATSFPYTRTQFYDDGTNRVKRSTVAGDVYKLGSGHEIFSASMQGGGELDNYFQIRQQFLTSANPIDNDATKMKVYNKTINVDQDGKQAVTFSDAEGKVLAAAMVGSNDLTDAIKPNSNPAIKESKALAVEYTLNKNAINGWQTFSNYTDTDPNNGNMYCINTYQFDPNSRVKLYETDINGTYFNLIGDWNASELYNSSSNVYIIFGLSNNIPQFNTWNRFMVVSDKPFTYIHFGSTTVNYSSDMKLSHVPYHFEVDDNISLRNNTVELHITANNTVVTLTDLTPTAYYPPITLTTDEKKIFVYDLKSSLQQPLMTDPTPYSMNSTTATSTNITLQPGFYKIILNNTKVSVKVNYQLKYTDWAYYYYDDAGRPIGSIAPEGIDFNNTGTVNPNFKSTYTYNSLGQITQKTSVDESGVTNYYYRSDGLLKFAQNPKQGTTKFSYIAYDDSKRPVEVGEAQGDGQLLNNMITYHMEDVGSPYIDLKLNVTYNAYDMPVTTDPINPSLTFSLNYTNQSSLSGYVQHFLARKISRICRTDENNGIVSVFWYSYDYRGRIEWVIQYIKDLGYKTVDYQYDDFTGNLLSVVYQKFGTDNNIMYYTYDCNNRLIKAESKLIGGVKQHEASYFYYKHGPLKRIELAKRTVGANTTTLQGIDYIYTITGALKSINDPTLNGADPGGDGVGTSTTKADAFGMMLTYYQGDYISANSQLSVFSPNPGTSPIPDYFNGNIGYQFWKTKNTTTTTTPSTLQGMHSYGYTYDYHNWMTNAQYGISGYSQSLGSLTFGVNDNEYKEGGITYDLNGNIKTMQRKAYTGNVDLDNLSYIYYPNTNKLKQVTDAFGAPKIAGLDIGNQTNTDNYIYDAIGETTTNKQDNQVTEYNFLGKVSGIKQFSDPTKYWVKFYYDANGFRCIKETYNYNGSNVLQSTIRTYYVNDLAGNVLSMYNQPSPFSTGIITQTEIPIYAAGRIGEVKLNGSTRTYLYELNDHLGNVRTILDGDPANTSNYITSIASYYPFGMSMPGTAHNITSTLNYRYGYQGQFAEKDPETGLNSFQARMYDARLGRWTTIDQAKQFHSPYLAMGNTPNMAIDKDGNIVIIVTGELGGTYYFIKGAVAKGYAVAIDNKTGKFEGGRVFTTTVGAGLGFGVSGGIQIQVYPAANSLDDIKGYGGGFSGSLAFGPKVAFGTSWSYKNSTLKSFLKDGPTRNNKAGNSINVTAGAGAEASATWDFSKTWIYNRTNNGKDAIKDIIKMSVPGIDLDLIQQLIKDAGFSNSLNFNFKNNIGNNINNKNYTSPDPLVH